MLSCYANMVLLVKIATHDYIKHNVFFIQHEDL